MELDFLGFDDRPQQAGAAIGGGLLQFGVTSLDIGAKQLGGPLGLVEHVHRVVNVVGKVAFCGAKPLDFGDGSVNPGLEDGVENQVRIGVGSDRTDFDACAALV